MVRRRNWQIKLYSIKRRKCLEKIYLTIPVQCCLSIPSENKTNNGTKQNNIKTPDEYDNQDVIVGSEIKG